MRHVRVEAGAGSRHMGVEAGAGQLSTWFELSSAALAMMMIQVRRRFWRRSRCGRVVDLARRGARPSKNWCLHFVPQGDKRKNNQYLGFSWCLHFVPQGARS